MSLDIQRVVFWYPLHKQQEVRVREHHGNQLPRARPTCMCYSGCRHPGRMRRPNVDTEAAAAGSVPSTYFARSQLGVGWHTDKFIRGGVHTRWHEQFMRPHSIHLGAHGMLSDVVHVHVKRLLLHISLVISDVVATLSRRTNDPSHALISVLCTISLLDKVLRRVPPSPPTRMTAVKPQCAR